MADKVSFKGSPLTLVGRKLKQGVQAPDFKVFSADLKEISLYDFFDKIKVITSFLSLDTPVCDLQVKEFNKRASVLSKDVIILGISKDLPFAQKRFCDAFSLNALHLFSDYKTSSFGINYGLLVKELNLLARAVLILDKSNILRFFQINEELTQAPNYDLALQALEKVLKNPSLPLKKEILTKCVPCKGKVAPLSKDLIEQRLAKAPLWTLVEEKKIIRDFKFKDFVEAKYFLDLIAILAEEQGHHPSFSLIYNKLKVSLTTHAAGGLTENDFIIAKLIDELG